MPDVVLETELTDETVLTQYVNFVLADELYAVPMQRVEEIIRLPQTFAVPLTPEYLIGLANLRGQILPILSLRCLLQMERAQTTDATRVVVMKVGQAQVGFTVDKVINVATPDPAAIKETNTAGGKIDIELIENTVHQGDDIIQVLNVDRLFDTNISEEIERSASHFSSMQNLLTETEEREDEQLQQLVCCLVDDQEYAFHLEDTQEIVRIPASITQVPKAGDGILGVMNLRARTLPLVSLRSLFGMAQIPFEDNHRVLVVNIALEQAQIPIGIVVDGVREVLSLHQNQFDEVPSIMSHMGQSKDISAICNLEDGRRTLSVVDVNYLFNPQMYEGFNAVIQEEELMLNEQAETLIDDDETDTQLVIFKLDKEEFGISIHAVQEIIRIPNDISKVPKTDDFIEGVINLRGNVLPIVDLRRRFDLPYMERHERQRILVVHFEKVSTGFVVDCVSEVLRIPESQLEAAPVLSEEQAQLMKQVVNFNNRMIGVLCSSQLLSNTEMYKLYMAANEANE